MWSLILETAYLCTGLSMLALLVWLDSAAGSLTVRWPRRPSTFCPGLPFGGH